jgi:hypothetical protein
MGMASLARVRLFLGSMMLAVVCTVRPVSATGVELTEREIAELSAGRAVVREDTVEHAGRRYIGGVSYVLIDAAPERVILALDDVRAFRHILPRTRNVRWLGIARNGDSIIELEQGNSAVHGKYTVRVRRDRTAEGGSSNIVRFWLDPRFSHDIADASGFFRVEPAGDKTLLTYLVMVDLGPGLFSRLFEGRIRRAALSTPTLVKKYVEALPPAT